MTTDPLAAAIDHIRSVTNRAWCAEDFEESPGNPVDASIAMILNAVSEGQLINRASRDEMLAQVRRGEVFASAGAEGRWIADSDAGVYDADSAHGESKTGYWVPRKVAQDEIARLTAERDQALAGAQAQVAAAYEAAASVQVEGMDYCSPSTKAAIRALTPADAQAALDKLLGEARLEGWRAGRDAAIARIARHVDTLRVSPSSSHQIAAYEFESMAEIIRALPEPKEASHD